MFPGSESTAVSRSSIGALQYFFVGGIVTTLHAALFAFDVTGGDGFLRADRASQRIHAIKGLMNSIGDVAALGPFLVKQGNIGDYGVHAVFYWLGGPLGVILFQVFLAIVSAMCVTYIAWRAFFSKSVAILSGTLYGILPQSLAFPHQLVTEAISTPLIVIGTAGFVRALGNPGKSAVWILSGLAMEWEV